jgi:predicted component of type VI protein secretion system
MEIYDWNYSSSNSNFYRSYSNATGVALNKTITANFSMVMDPSTINTTNFTLKQGTTAITGVVTYSGTTASFKPTNALEGKTYTATSQQLQKMLPEYL